MKNIVSFSFLLLVFANLSFAQTLQDTILWKKREKIFDKAQFEIFCQTIQHVSKNGKKPNSWYPKTICELGNININNIYKYLGHKEQIAGGHGHAPSLYKALKAAKGKLGVNGKDIAKDSEAIATIIKNLKTELKRLPDSYVKDFDSLLLPKLNTILADAVKEAEALKKENKTSISGTNDDNNEIADQNNDLVEDEPEINQNENSETRSQLDTLRKKEKDIITRLKNLEAQINDFQYWHFVLTCFIVVLLIIILIIIFINT